MAKRDQAAPAGELPEFDAAKYRERVEKSANKWEALRAQHSTRNFSWADAGAEDLRDMVAAVVADGSAVLLASTSDGGALVIQILNGKGRHKLYPTDELELAEAISLVRRTAEA